MSFRIFRTLDRSDFYRISIDIIYSFIVGESLFRLGVLITPFQKIISNFDLILGVALVYYIIFAGWSGYHKSVLRQKHWKFFGSLRYLFDLVITVIIYNLLLVSDPSSRTMYWEIFIYLIPILFTLYLIWDMLKIIETRKRYPNYSPSIRGFEITALYASFTLVIAISYFIIMHSQEWTRDLTTNRTSLDLFFIFLYIGHTFFYRRLKSILEVRSVQIR